MGVNANPSYVGQTKRAPSQFCRQHNGPTSPSPFYLLIMVQYIIIFIRVIPFFFFFFEPPTLLLINHTSLSFTFILFLKYNKKDENTHPLEPQLYGNNFEKKEYLNLGSLVNESMQHHHQIIRFLAKQDY